MKVKCIKTIAVPGKTFFEGRKYDLDLIDVYYPYNEKHFHMNFINIFE
jgi:hypothetical protein